jgi:hypothetical protein
VVCTGLIWLMIGSSGGLLWTWRWTFRFRKMLVIFLGSCTSSGFSRGVPPTEIICKYVRFEVFTAVTMKNVVFWVLDPVRTSQETHYLSATVSSQLMQCMIWGFHGSDYEECRLLGYKTPVRTSQETHYVSDIESSQLMLGKIWGFHGGDYEECRLLGCNAVWFL